MTSERAEQPETPPRDRGHPGKLLAAQREAMGWTVEQVADQLKLAVRQVIALEAGDHAALPSPAVTRGFVRAYAKILKMDAAPLVAMIEMDTPVDSVSNTAATRRDKPASFSEVRFSPGGKRSSLPLGWIVGVLAVLAAGVAAWHFGVFNVAAPGSGSSTTLPAPVNGGSAPAAAAPSASEATQNPAVPLISVPSPSGAAPEAAPSAPAASSPTVPAGTETPAVAPTAAPAAAPAAPATGANALVFNVREDSWISVVPAKGGKPLLSALVKAGSTEKVNVSEPVKVVVGNAPGVSATLRGAAVALPGKVARINLK
jgi:cytoskeleton protein RodZ